MDRFLLLSLMILIQFSVFQVIFATGETDFNINIIKKMMGKYGNQ